MILEFCIYNFVDKRMNVCVMNVMMSSLQDFEPSPALFIEPIFSKIISHLPFHSLLNCRFVCSEWNSQIVNHIVLKSLGRARFLYDEIASPRKRRRRLTEFLNVIKCSQQSLYTEYNLANLPSLYIADPNIKRLFDLAGSRMKSLQVEIPASLDLLSFVMDLSGLAPNLESLRLTNVRTGPSKAENNCNLENFDICSEGSRTEWSLPDLKKIAYVQQDDNAGASAIQWKLLFQGTPNLREIVMRFNGKLKNRDPLSPIEEPMLEGFKASGRMILIKSLTLSGLDDTTLSLLMDGAVNHNLSLWKLDVHKISSNSNIFNQFLESQRNSLEKLRVQVALESVASTPRRNNQRCQYIVPKEMSSLKYIDFALTIDGFLFQLEDYKDLPKLREVHIHEIICDMAEKMSKGFCSPTVHTLSVCFQNGQWEREREHHFQSPNSITSLGKMFPSVKVLTLTRPTCSQLRRLYLTWPKLKSLRLLLQKNDFSRVVNFSNYENFIENFPSICNLKQLKTLTIVEHHDTFQEKECPHWTVTLPYANVKSIKGEE